MRDDAPAPIGGEGATVEIDETYVGNIPGIPKVAHAHKNVVLTLVQRGGSARSFHVDNASIATIKPIAEANIARETAIMTDEWTAYKVAVKGFKSHETVNHKREEYVRGHVTTNTVENYFSVFKRGMKGVYQHCGERHLHRYLVEFDFRYSYRAKLGYDDTQRTLIAMKGAGGKRLTYRQPRAS